MRPLRRWLRSGTAACLIGALAGTAVAQEPAKQSAGEIPELPPIEDLNTTVERPLFMPSRRPPKAPAPVIAAAAPVTVASEDAPADLTGIVSGPDRTYAILTSRATKEIHHLRTGEKIDDWSVQEIGPRYVVLRRGPGSLRLELFEEKEPGSKADGDGSRGVNRPPPNTRPRFVPQSRQVRQPQRTRPRPTRRPVRRQQDN